MNDTRPPEHLPLGWRMVRFDQLAEPITDRVDPAEADTEIYVGLEHLDPESLKIRRWGTPDDVIGEKLRFRAGDVIFGRRRFYQRKLAVAEFDGICSAHAMVLRARESVMLQEFLPFFMQGETFFRRAMQISVGSLSPTINWRTLARQEFAIPPLDEQRRIAEILWAADDLVCRMEDCGKSMLSFRATLFDHWLTNGLSASQSPSAPSWSQIRLGKLMTSSPESGYSAVSAGKETEHFVLILSALGRTGYQSGNLKPVELIPEVEATKLSKGDFLISRSNTFELVGLVGIFDEDREDVSFPDTMMRLHLDEDRVDKRFLEQVLLSRHGRCQIQRIAAGTSASMKKINRRELAKISIPLPPLNVQRSIIERVDIASETVFAVERNLANCRQLKTALMKELL